MKIKAHTFQHSLTGVQIFIFHKNSRNEAESKFKPLVLNYDDWVYVGVKTVLI